MNRYFLVILTSYLTAISVDVQASQIIDWQNRIPVVSGVLTGLLSAEVGLVLGQQAVDTFLSNSSDHVTRGCVRGVTMGLIGVVGSAFAAYLTSQYTQSIEMALKAWRTSSYTFVILTWISYNTEDKIF